MVLDAVDAHLHTRIGGKDRVPQVPPAVISGPVRIGEARPQTPISFGAYIRYAERELLISEFFDRLEHDHAWAPTLEETEALVCRLVESNVTDLNYFTSVSSAGELPVLPYPADKLAIDEIR